MPVIVTGLVKARSLDFSHLITDPVLPLNVRSAGEVPEQIVWAEDTVPPTLVGLTLNVTFCVKDLLQLGVVLVVVMLVICKVCPLLADVNAVVVKLAAPEALATTPVTAVCATPLIE